MRKYTPGKWVAEPHPLPDDFTGDPELHGWWDIHEAGHSATRVPIAIVDHHRDGDPPTRAKAEHDARLIAAAPSLLEALEVLLEVHDALGAGKSTAAIKAREAISLAAA